MLRIILFINDNVKDLAGPPPWGHGTVIAARQQLINLYDGETGRNGDIYSDWVTAGSNEEWRWFTTDWHGHPEPAQKFYPGGAIKSGGVVSIVEDTDYVLASLWEQDLKQGVGDWALVALMTDRIYPAERLADYPLYSDPGDWE